MVIKKVRNDQKLLTMFAAAASSKYFCAACKATISEMILYFIKLYSRLSFSKFFQTERQQIENISYYVNCVVCE